MRPGEVSAPLTHTMHQKGSEGKAIQSEGETGRVTTAAQRLRPSEIIQSFGLFRGYYRKPMDEYGLSRASVFRYLHSDKRTPS